MRLDHSIDCSTVEWLGWGAWRNAEIAKLGSTGPARVDAVSTWAKATLGEAEGKQFVSRMVTASDVAIAEKLIARMTNQGAGGFTQSGRTPPEPAGRKSAEEVGKMSLPDQLAYARQFPQKQFQKDERAA